MDSFFPDVLTFPDDGQDGQIDGTFNGLSSNQTSYFAQGGFQDSNAELNSFFPGTGLTPLGTPGMGMFGNSQNFPWGDPTSAYSMPQDLQHDKPLNPTASVESTTNDTTSEELSLNGVTPQMNNDISGEDLSKPKRGRPRKKRDKKQLSLEEENAKRQKFLERNRLAASKCRDRKKNWTQDTMDRLAREEKKHVDLQMEFSRLQAECASLMEAACQHIGHCDKNDGFQEALAQSSQRFAGIVQSYSESVGVDTQEHGQDQFDLGDEVNTPRSTDEPSHKRARLDSITDEPTDPMGPTTPPFSNREIRAFKRQSVAPILPVSDEDLVQSPRMCRRGSVNSSGSSGGRDSGISNLDSPVKANSLSPTDEGYFGLDDRATVEHLFMMPNPRVAMTPQVKLEALLRARNFSNSSYLSQNVERR